MNFTPTNPVESHGITYESLYNVCPKIYDLNLSNRPPKRFIVEEGYINGKRAIRKSISGSIDERMREIATDQIEREMRAADSFGNIPGTPKVLEKGETWIVYEYIVGEVISIPFDLDGDLAREDYERPFQLLIDALSLWNNIGNSIYNGNSIRENDLYSIGGMQQRFENLIQKDFYTIEGKSDIQICLSQEVNIERLSRVVKSGFKTLNNLQLSEVQNPVLLHLDFSPQNIIVKGRTVKSIIDTENVCFAKDPIAGFGADAAFLVSRLWFSQSLQDELYSTFRSTFENCSKSEQVAFELNVILEALSRVSRPLHFYATKDENAQYTYSERIKDVLPRRFLRNMALIEKAVQRLETLLEQ